MKEKPILFNTEMVKAIMEDRKTQTRRVIKPQPPHWNWNTVNTGSYNLKLPSGKWVKSPYGKPGDLLWVRETWAPMCKIWDGEGGCDCETDEHHFIEYKADTGNPYPGDWPVDLAKGNPDAPKWRPSIFMKKKHARIWLKVKDVRVERVQDISQQDALAEGCRIDALGRMLINSTESSMTGLQVVEWFIELWDGINEKRGYGWSQNPWCWVVEFERIDK